MNPAMAYMVALEDGEIVKLTANGFESTGMYIIPSGGAPVTYETVWKSARVTANA
jgi:hypothetical protein